MPIKVGTVSIFTPFNFAVLLSSLAKLRAREYKKGLQYISAVSELSVPNSGIIYHAYASTCHDQSAYNIH